MVNKELSVLIGGKAGDGVDQAGMIIARILNQLGYYIYIYRDYPSLIRGGHTFSIIRASDRKITTHNDKVDFLLALNQDCIDLHPKNITSDTVIIKAEDSTSVMRNSNLIGAFCKSAGIGWEKIEAVFRQYISKEIETNLKIARQGYDGAKEVQKIDHPTIVGKRGRTSLPILSGNEAIGLGLVKGGLKAYVAYPMTPTSSILHFLASSAEEFQLKVVHPESEIAVMLMALGFAYAGEKVAVGTSGGGFCLMTEGVSFAGMAEIPIVIVMGQRPGPSTGLPTYSSQTELRFVLHAGQGEFPRLIVAPGDAEEAYHWSTVVLNAAWQFQIPAFVLTDKTLSEGTFSFEPNLLPEIEEEIPVMWDGRSVYKRYLDTNTGISPLTFVPNEKAEVKINSYEHDESGITTEDPNLTVKMNNKRLRKNIYLMEYLEKMKLVNVSGAIDSSTAVICWGSNKGVVGEAAAELGLKIIQPVVLSPFPLVQLRKALEGIERLICVENNATGQLASLCKANSIVIDSLVLRYDGRSFSLDEMKKELNEVL